MCGTVTPGSAVAPSKVVGYNAAEAAHLAEGIGEPLLAEVHSFMGIAAHFTGITLLVPVRHSGPGTG